MYRSPIFFELHNISKASARLLFDGAAQSEFPYRRRRGGGLLGDNGAGSRRPSTSSPAFTSRRMAISASTARRRRSPAGRIPADAGIETIHQHTALVDLLSITRNIFMGRELTDRFGFLRQSEMREIAMEVLQNAVHISGIDSPDTLVGNLSGGQKQAVAIASRHLFQEARPAPRRADIGPGSCATEAL